MVMRFFICWICLFITDDCKLEFKRDNRKVIIKTIEGNCPFGYGVYADGVYYIHNRKNPLFFVDRGGKKTYFEKTSPEEYEE